MKFDEIEYRCGHTGMVTLRNKDSEDWVTGNLCPRCANAPAAAKAAEQAAEQGLPDLVGSEKQVAWALTLRAATVKRLEDQRKEFLKKVDLIAPKITPENMAKFEADNAEIFALLEGVRIDWLSRPEAKWWIENQSKVSYIKGAMKELREAPQAEQAPTMTEAQQKALRHEDTLRQVAIQARELMDVDFDFVVNIWQRAADKRVYIGTDFENNWVSYWHTGNRNITPNTIKFEVRETQETKDKIKEYCKFLCENFEPTKLRVTQKNAPYTKESK